MRATLCIMICFTLWVSLFSGCAKPAYKTSSATKIVLKLGTIRFNDLGYIHYANNAIKLELYNTGASFVALELFDDSVCLKQGCLGYDAFYQKMGLPPFPKDLLRHIFSKEAIYSSKGLSKVRNGFMQRIKNETVDIVYKVDEHHLVFKERYHHIIIKIEEL